MRRPSAFLRAFDDWLDHLDDSTPGDQARGTPPCGSDSDAPIVGGGRIHVHQAGFSISVPDDWYAFNPWHPDLRIELEAYDETTQHLMEGHHETTAFFAVSTTGPDNLIVAAWPAPGTTLEEAAKTTSEVDAEHFGDIQQEAIDLPSGTAVRSLMTLGPEGSEDVLTFLWMHEGWTYILDCVGDIRHGDLWLSMAESLEFLPAQ